MNDNQNTHMNMPRDLNETHHGHVGPILGILVMALVIILGGLYLWGGMLAEEEAQTETPIVNNEPETPRATADAEILETLSPSDELDAIEADLISTNLDSLDADMTAIDAELGS